MCDGHAQNQQKHSYQRNTFHKKIHFDMLEYIKTTYMLNISNIQYITRPFLVKNYAKILTSKIISFFLILIIYFLVTHTGRIFLLGIRIEGYCYLPITIPCSVVL